MPQDQNNPMMNVSVRDPQTTINPHTVFSKKEDLSHTSGASAPTEVDIKENNKGNVITSSQNVNTGGNDNSEGKTICRIF